MALRLLFDLEESEPDDTPAPPRATDGPVSVPVSTPYFPAELTSNLVSHLDKADVKTLRYLSRYWAYDPIVIDLLFGTMEIFPHRSVLKLFLETFRDSPVRHRVVHLVFRFVRFCRGIIDVDGMQTSWRARRSGNGGSIGQTDVRAEEVNDDGQLSLVPLLLDVFQITSELRQISTQDLKRLLQRNASEEYDIFDERAHLLLPCAPSSDCRFGLLCRIDGTGWAPERSQNDSTLGAKLEYAVPATLYYAASLSRLQLESMRFEWIDQEGTLILEQWASDAAVMVPRDKLASRYVHGDALTDSTNFKVESLEVNFDGRSFTTSRLALARLQVLYRISTVRALQLALDSWVTCWQLNSFNFKSLPSSLENIQSMRAQPLFASVQKLHLSAVKCRPIELETFLDFHLPRLQELTFDGIALYNKSSECVSCWVRFFKSFRRTCGRKLRKLEITNFLCNSAWCTASNLVQHWHICHSTKLMGDKADGQWLKEAMLSWFHDQNMDDSMCPLNVWELDDKESQFRTFQNNMSSDSEGDSRRETVSDASWTPTLCLEPDEDMGFGLFD